MGRDLDRDKDRERDKTAVNEIENALDLQVVIGINSVAEEIRQRSRIKNEIEIENAVLIAQRAKTETENQSATKNQRTEEGAEGPLVEIGEVLAKIKHSNEIKTEIRTEIVAREKIPKSETVKRLVTTPKKIKTTLE